MILVATGLDVVLNYPLWILGKRLGAGLKAPRKLLDYYKGGGLLWASYGPTLVLEDHTQRVLGNFVTPAQGSLLAGVSGALFVATWVETYIDITALDAPDETFFHVAAKYNPVVYV
eukprot:GEMP01056548.1.p2 GENE.GEMP01056548.1~~GEMP01056548.1.p2  ORF type:complete len:116 (+),score=26.60 GEMP01056548.1:319-666(+)